MSIFVAHQGEGDDGQLWQDAYDGQNWAGDRQIGNLGMSASPSAVVYNGRLYYFHQGLGENGQLWYTSTSDGKTWARDTQVQPVGMSASPSAVAWAGTSLPQL
jgi:photosystem II stability/assembly factor-like uncharacterized protein